MKQLFWLFILFISVSCSHHKRDVSVIAHRGASGYLPEHSFPGIAMAHAWNVDFIEADLVMTKDNHLIVLHDHFLDTTTNVESIFPKRKRKDGRYYVIDFNLREIKKLSLRERFHHDSKKPYFEKRFHKKLDSLKIPTFIEFIEMILELNRISKKHVGIYPEIKRYFFHQNNKKDIVGKTIEILRRYHFETNNLAIIQSFYPQALIELKQKHKTKIPLVQLIGEDSWEKNDINFTHMKSKDGLAEVAKYADGVGFWLNQLKELPARSSFAKENQLFVHTFTLRLESVPENMTFKNYLNEIIKDYQLDGIFADQADLVIEELGH